MKYAAPGPCWVRSSRVGAAGENAALAIEAAFREIEIIHRLMSFHETDSDIARLNRAPLLTAQQVDPRTYEVLSWAQKISALSDGAFDITVGGKLVAAGFLPKPEDAEWPSEEANFRDLSLLSDNRVLLRRRAWIDLGGIAKGYAVDRAAATLKCNGVDSGIVNAGGDLYAFGAPSQSIFVTPKMRRDYFLLALSQTRRSQAPAAALPSAAKMAIAPIHWSIRDETPQCVGNRASPSSHRVA